MPHRGLRLTNQATSGSQTPATIASRSSAAQEPISNKFGVEGTGAGQLKEPNSLVIDANGNIWVLDASNDRVEQFSSTGTYISEFGTYGSGAGQLHQPQGLAIDQAGNVWVVDDSNNRIEEFTANGRYLGQFGTAGSGNGQVSEPRGIALDNTGHAWVVDTNNNRVEQWKIATPHATQAIYYSSEANPAVPACGKHPEWAGAPCQTRSATEPGTSGLPWTARDYLFLQHVR